MKSIRLTLVVLLFGLTTAGALLAERPITPEKLAWKAQMLERQQELQDRAERLRLADQIMSDREALGDREFDAEWKARMVLDLAEQPLEALQAMSSDPGAAGFLKDLGDSAADLVFTPLDRPCRFYDSRTDDVAGPFFAGEQFDMYVAGFIPGTQGASTNCGVPYGPTTAVVVNVLAVDTGGKGNWQVWPFDGTPGDAVINFAANSDLDINLINGVMIPTCDPSVHPTGCAAGDLTARLNFAAFSHFVINVTGYFSRVPTEEVKVVTERAVSGDTVTLPAFPDCAHYTGAAVTIVAPVAGTIVVNANAWLLLSHDAGTSDQARVNIGTTMTDCSLDIGNTMANEVSAGVGDDGSVHMTIPTRNVYSVGPGTYTYYLNGFMSSGADPFDDFWYADIIAQFFPD